MKIITLIEDTEGEEKLPAEHGLSFFIETEKHRLLVDTGASDLTWKNAEELNVDVKSVDTVVISHGHYDHAGGLLDFCQMNSKAKIYMRENADGEFMHGEKYIGIDRKIMDIKNLVLTGNDMKINDELYLFSGIKGRRLWPESNRLLSEKKDDRLVQDEFTHEQCLVIRSEGKNVLVSGCAHNGILNILDRYKEIFGGCPDAVLSGFHMMKKTPYTDEEISGIRKTANELKKLDTVFYTGHCTGDAAYGIMKEIMGEKLEKLYSGRKILL